MKISILRLIKENRNKEMSNLIENMSILLFQAGKKSAECVKVIVRCRPMNEKEIAANHERSEKCF